ncbi:chromatin assembly factor 1 subunit FAS1 [Magnolia sinica]|uniref:chromatin assembly factor 1 subunit FAS1 n=1 Tax=Magnolia sinica TaxID=86752 RepID=UPI00265A588B|nr:chromatin assembly factor 1 subunit FAS1 [Magnolia sinica]
MVDVVILDESSMDGLDQSEKDQKKCVKKSCKRKRSSVDESVSSTERESLVARFHREVDGLYAYFKEVMHEKMQLEESGCTSSNSQIACLLEESRLPFSKLVEEIYERLKSREGTTLASVCSSVLSVGQRSMFGIANADSNVLEDDSELCLWCWETRDMKLLPKTQRGILNIRRICRKKIYERISALSVMLSALSMPESQEDYKTILTKASEKLGRSLSEAEIRSLVGHLIQKNNADMAEKEVKLKEKELIKDMERNKREVEKEKKRKDRELQREKWQSEKELKRLRDEAEKEERRREKEEAELKKQLKRQQDEAEKDQRRREKEETEFKKQLAIKKQASIMERFLKSKKNNSDVQDNMMSSKASEPDSFGKSEEKLNAITLSMDCALSQGDGVCTNDLLKSHLVTWNKLSHSLRNHRSHWGVRHKPKISPIKELKLQGPSSEVELSGKVTTLNKGLDSSEVKDNNEPSLEKLVGGWDETVMEDKSCHINADNALTSIQSCNKTKKLLQFDKSYRPAYYGTSSRKSDVIGPHHPFKKDPDLDYDVESDEEWEEEDPGESLSDCDKDDEEENPEEGILKDDDDDGSEDSFMVPDGYLSENEGVQVDSMDSDIADDDTSMPSCKQDVESDEFRALFRHQKYLYNLTENALRRNQPLIISNLMHEKTSLMITEDLSGSSKIEQICLQALSMRSCPGGTSIIDLSTDAIVSSEDKEVCQSQSKSDAKPAVAGVAILDSDLPEIVSCIQSCPHGINKVVESLQRKFPAVSKLQLRNKVREISDFMDNRWQVKKEILDNLGLSISPDKSIVKRKGIATFFSKRCLPPSGETINVPESSLQPCCKLESCQDGNRYIENETEP